MLEISILTNLWGSACAVRTFSPAGHLIPPRHLQDGYMHTQLYPAQLNELLDASVFRSYINSVDPNNTGSLLFRITAFGWTCIKYVRFLL